MHKVHPILGPVPFYGPVAQNLLIIITCSITVFASHNLLATILWLHNITVIENCSGSSVRYALLP